MAGPENNREVNGGLDAETVAPRPAPATPVTPGAAAPAGPPLGSEIAGRYRLLEVLGRGGMGVVYRARDRLVDADVAMKWIAALDGRGLEAVRDEVRLARLVSHPAVCRLHDMVDHEDGCFLTMEYVAGESLAQRLEAGRLPRAEASRVLRDVCDGLAAAHAAGVVHRDLKPSNVLLRPGGGAVIADFGIAARAGGGAQAAGTRGFMAPEQAAGSPADARSDVYALGAIARCLSDDLPEPLARLAADCTAEDPGARPADAGEVARRLHALDRRRPRRTLALAAGMVAIAGLVAGGLAARGGGDTAPPAAGPLVAPELIRVEVAAGQLPPADAWLPDALASLIAAEIEDAWGVPARAAGGVDRDGTAVLRVRVGRDPGGKLVASTSAFAPFDPSPLPLAETSRDTPRALAEEVARAAVDALVPADARRPSEAELARAGARSTEAWRLWRRGRRAARMLRPDRARALLRRAGELDPEFPLPHLELALTYPYIAEPAAGAAFARAEKLARGASGLDPIWPAVIAVVRAAAGDGKDLQATYAALLRLPMDRTDRLQFEFRWAVSAMSGAAPLPAALALMEKVAETYPDDPAAAKMLARFYVGPSEMVSTRRALHFGARAAALAPDDVAVRADHARALLLDGKREQALVQARIAERGDPADKQADAARLFHLHMALGELDEAAADARRALADPEAAIQARIWLAYVDLRRGAFARGLTAMEQAIGELDRAGQPVVAALNRIELGWNHYLLGDFAAARRAFAAARVPGTMLHGTVMEKVAAFAAAPRRERPGLAAARAALARAQPGPLPQFLALVIAHAEGRFTEVIRLHHLQSVDGSRMESVHLAADALERLGRHDEALRAFENLATHPVGWIRAVVAGEAWQRVGALRERAGDRAGAIAAYRHLVDDWARADLELPRLRLARERLRALDRPVNRPGPAD